jgi:hypothetical protein
MSIIRVDQGGRVIGPKMKGIAPGEPRSIIPGIPFELAHHDLKKIGSGELGLDINVTYKKATRRYSLIGEDVRLHQFSGEWEEEGKRGLPAPVYDPNGGRPDAYLLMGRMWKAPGVLPVIMSLKDDSNLAATGMDKAKVLAATGAACSEWNRCTSGKPFNEKAALTTSPNWKLDGCNNIAFQPATCTALAWTGVWYKTQNIPIGQMYPIKESDMTFNSRLKWGLGEAGKLDFQSVALHELGHTLGLGDLYGRAINDGKQIMGYYTGVRRTLGNGDSNGVWHLYG